MDPKLPMYESVSLTEDQEELLSTTEVDELELGDEKQWHSLNSESDRRSKKRSLMATFRSYRWLIDTLLLLVNITLSVLLLRDQWKDSTPVISRQVGGDYSGAGPEFPTKVVKFEADMSFAPKNTSELFTSENLARWNTLMPGWGSTAETFFTTSMTHQLHCLYMMTRIYAGVTNNITEALPADYHVHYLHCVDYLRQSIMCSADLATEPHEPNGAADLGPLDGGWNGHHVCKDYSQVIEYLEGQINEGVRVVLPIDD